MRGNSKRLTRHKLGTRRKPTVWRPGSHVKEEKMVTCVNDAAQSSEIWRKD